MKPVLIIFDAGHGGMVKVGEQTIYDTFPKKLHKFKEDVIAYEGVINRNIKDIFIEEWSKDNRPYVDVTATNLDLPLEIRVDTANSIYDKYKNKYNIIFLSIHCNASPKHDAQGFEIITSIGKTKSDELATIIYNNISYNNNYKVKLRSDFSDGDPDKEMDLYILTKTKMPSVLMEVLFFDYYNDFKLLTDAVFIRNFFVRNVINGTLEYEKLYK